MVPDPEAHAVHLFVTTLFFNAMASRTFFIKVLKQPGLCFFTMWQI
jgi:hypothetical protein